MAEEISYSKVLEGGMVAELTWAQVPVMRPPQQHCTMSTVLPAPSPTVPSPDSLPSLTGCETWGVTVLSISTTKISSMEMPTPKDCS